MAISTNQITVSTSTGATTVLGRGSGGRVDDTVPMLFTNQDGTNSVYLTGSATVGTSSGYELKAGLTLTFNLFGGDALFAWTPTAGGVRVDSLLGRQ